ncbi:MAG: ribosome silencing factor [Clostridia bacterium]|nr:ribosome silencing factor [Clostridia bacterium]
MELSPRDLALRVAQILSDKKASDVEVLEIGDLTVLADYFVICTGMSSTQVRSLAEEVEFKLSEQGIEPHHIEGHRSTTWILLDYSSVVVHVFYKESRDFYRLEHMWADAKRLVLPEAPREAPSVSPTENP